jgi:fermentation-respiration switch protein FrsA (DUF1100 family)
VANNRRWIQRWVLGKASWGRLVRSLLLIYVVLCLYVMFVADRMIFLPPPASYRDMPNLVKLTTEDGLQIAALYLPNPAATYTILFSHGNAEDIGQLRPYAEELHRAGFAVFAYDYRGYGRSQGTPTENGSYKDIAAAYVYLTNELAIAPQRILVMGRSIGSGPSTYLAAVKSTGGLILENAFTSILRVVLPFPLLPFDKFPNIEHISAVRSPVFIIHAQQDTIIPPAHGKELFAAANEPKQYWWVEKAGHNNLTEVAGEEYFERLKAFSRWAITHSASR